MSVRAFDACREVRHPSLNSTDYLALDMIAHRYFDRDERAIIGFDELATHLRSSRSTAKRVVKRLIAAGVIERLDDGRGGYAGSRDTAAQYGLPWLEAGHSYEPPTGSTALNPVNSDRGFIQDREGVHSEHRGGSSRAKRGSTAMTPTRSSRVSQKHVDGERAALESSAPPSGDSSFRPHPQDRGDLNPPEQQLSEVSEGECEAWMQHHPSATVNLRGKVGESGFLSEHLDRKLLLAEVRRIILQTRRESEEAAA